MKCETNKKVVANWCCSNMISWTLRKAKKDNECWRSNIKSQRPVASAELKSNRQRATAWTPFFWHQQHRTQRQVLWSNVHKWLTSSKFTGPHCSQPQTYATSICSATMQDSLHNRSLILTAWHLLGAVFLPETPFACSATASTSIWMCQI